MRPPRPQGCRALQLVAYLVAFSLCHTVATPPSHGAAEARSVLRVGTSGDYAPFSRAGVGFDHDVARLLADDLGLSLIWVPFRWPDLEASVIGGDFDVAMSGVTWRPRRAVVGSMSRAIAVGGPCLVGDPDPRRLAVNRGGILERWTRRRFPERDIRAVDDNLALPRLLAAGEVDAFTTDSFELPHFRQAGEDTWCEAPRDRKVYWVSSQAGPELAERIDTWMASREAEIDALRRRHFGVSTPRAEVDHLLDLLHRRMSFMPLVAAWKSHHRVPVEDREREARVLARAAGEAQRLSFRAGSLERFFEIQIEIAKAIQRRAPPRVPSLDLERDIRPVLLRLGDRIANSLAKQVPLDSATLSRERLAFLEDLLEPEEIMALREALLEIQPVRSKR